MTRFLRLAPYLLALALFAPMAAFAQAAAPGAANATGAAAASGLTIDFNGTGLFTDRMMKIIALVTVLSIAPSILIMMTSFVRIVVVLSLLRTALSLQQSPPNAVIISRSMFLTLFVMGPTLTDAYNQGVKPLMANHVTTEQGFTAAMVALKKFMLEHMRGADLKLFTDMAKTPVPRQPQDAAITSLAPAFMLSELKLAFEISFLLFVPFLIIDMAAASILMSMGMMMLPQVIISLPFKLIFFVLVDG